jgi:short-subunit dehydrogenase
MAQAFARAGADLTLVARDEATLEKAAADVGGRALVADLTDRVQVTTLLDRAEKQAGRPIDVLVLNAGIDVNGPYADLSSDDLQQLWQVNLAAPAELIRQAQPSMTARRSGHIVAISSLSAQVAMPGLASYAASKAALSQLVMGVRRELRGAGIGTTLAEIGQATTDMYTTLRDYPPAAAAFDRATRLGFLRELKPDEVADAVVHAVRRDKPKVVLPRRARLQSLLAHSPQVIADRLFGSAK